MPTHWTGPFFIGGLGWDGQGAGLEIANLNGVGGPEMVLTAYDNPPGANTFRYRIGWNLATNGTPTSWSGGQMVRGIGWEADGADIDIFDVDGDGTAEIFLMCYDDPPGAKTFRYRGDRSLGPTESALAAEAGGLVDGEDEPQGPPALGSVHQRVPRQAAPS